MHHNDTPRDRGVPSGDLGAADGTPDIGRSLDDGRVQFAPRATAEGGPYVGRGPRGAFPAESQIAAQVCALMTSAGGVDASAIDVHVAGDEVTLEGTVGSQAERRLAENVALAVSTVRAVHNRLQVHREHGAGAQSGAMPQRTIHIIGIGKPEQQEGAEQC